MSTYPITFIVSELQNEKNRSRQADIGLYINSKKHPARDIIPTWGLAVVLISLRRKILCDAKFL
jgi:hypothetical protein